MCITNLFPHNRIQINKFLESIPAYQPAFSLINYKFEQNMNNPAEPLFSFVVTHLITLLMPRWWGISIRSTTTKSGTMHCTMCRLLHVHVNITGEYSRNTKLSTENSSWNVSTLSIYARWLEDIAAVPGSEQPPVPCCVPISWIQRLWAMLCGP